MDTPLEKATNTRIENQNVYGPNVTAGQVNMNFYDNPFLYCYNKKKGEFQENEKQLERLENTKHIIDEMVNLDVLRSCFKGNIGLYEKMFDVLLEEEHKYLERGFLDNGYFSVIDVIYFLCDHFVYERENNTIYVKVDGKKTDLSARYNGNKLILHFPKDISEPEVFAQLKKDANELKEAMTDYLYCSSVNGNILQFFSLDVESYKNTHFLTEDIRFEVSNSIIPNLIGPLYGDRPECGLREIIQNALDATKEYENKKEKLHPESTEEKWIDLTLRTCTEPDCEYQLVIRDYGIGMNKKILTNQYFVVGESSKRGDAWGQIGQFGIGALAAFLLGNKVTVRTRRVGEHMPLYQFTYESKAASEQNGDTINVKIMDDPEFQHGTEVCVNLREDILASLSLYNEVEMAIKSISKVLKLDKWYLETEYPIYFGDETTEEKKKTCLKNYREKEWVEIDLTGSVFGKLRVKYYWDGNRYDQYPVIYNGLWIKDGYTKENPDFYSYPIVSIKENDTRMINLNMERSKIDTDVSDIFKMIEQDIYRKAQKQIESAQGWIINRENAMEIDFYTYRSAMRSYRTKKIYLKDNVPLAFTKDSCCIYSRYLWGLCNFSLKKMLEYLDAMPESNLSNQVPGKILFVYGMKEKVRYDELLMNKYYVFSRATPDKAVIGNLITNVGANSWKGGQGIYVSNKILDRYFLDRNMIVQPFRKEVFETFYRKENIYFEKKWDAKTIRDIMKNEEVYRTVSEKMKDGYTIPETEKDVLTKTTAMCLGNAELLLLQSGENA